MAPSNATSRRFFGHTAFLKLMCKRFNDTQSHHHDGGWGCKNIWHSMSLGKHSYISWVDFCFWSICRLFHLVFTHNMHGGNFAKNFWGAYIFRHPYHSNSIKTPLDVALPPLRKKSILTVWGGNFQFSKLRTQQRHRHTIHKVRIV